MARTKIPAKKNPAQIRREYIMNPAKGLNNLVSDTLLDKREASALVNVSFIESGVITKRNGFQQTASQLVDPRGLGTYYTESVRQLMTIDGTTGKKLVNGAGAWVTVGGATFSAGQETTYTQARGKLYAWNGADGGTQYDATSDTWVRPGTMPRAKFAIFYKGYHVAAGVFGQPSRVYLSDGSDASDFTNDPAAITNTADPDSVTEVPGATVFAAPNNANIIDVAKDDGDSITGLGVFQDALIIFKENSIWQMTLDATTKQPVLQMVTNSIGCVSHRSIENVENDLYFLSRKGVYVLGNEPNFYTAIRTNELSARIRPHIESINPKYFSKANALYFRDVYMLAIPLGDTKINRILAYDRRYQAWSIWDTIAPNYMTEFIDGDNRSHLYFLQDGVSNGYMMEIVDGYYSDNGAPISAYWESKAIDADAVDITKRWESVGILLRQLQGTLNVTIKADGNEIAKETFISAEAGGGLGTGMIGDYWIGAGGDLPAELAQVGQPNVLADPSASTQARTDQDTTNVPYRIIVNQNARTLKFRIENSNNFENFALLGFVMGFYSFGHYKFDSSRKLF